MNRSLIAAAIAAVAVPLLLSGCSQAADAPDPQSPAQERLAELQSAGKVPASFPKDPSMLRVETHGDEFGIHWKGTPMTEDCTAGSGIPNSTASAMMLQDVGIEDVQECGTVWQAKQADGSYIAWNTVL